VKDKIKHIQNARNLMRSQHSGALATISLSLKGFPFGSVVPFMMTETGNIIIYASDIAQHSRNMKADSKVSLCVYDNTQADSQSSARVTILANAHADKVSSDEQNTYLALFPQAKAYVEAHDFRFYLLETERVRYIGGFGEIYWFSREEWVDDVAVLAKQSAGIIQHMHEDHADALSLIINRSASLKSADGEVKMLSCFAQGFHFSCHATVGFIPFLQEVSQEYDVRKAMVDLTMLARKRDLA
jgi:putative heme iron utilization protein